MRKPGNSFWRPNSTSVTRVQPLPSRHLSGLAVVTARGLGPCRKSAETFSIPMLKRRGHVPAGLLRRCHKLVKRMQNTRSTLRRRLTRGELRDTDHDGEASLELLE